jgi:CheY-like chemotaxis protein
MGLDILVIESDAHRRVAVARTLARRNNRVTISSSVEEADEILRFVTHRAAAPQAVVIGENLLTRAMAFRERLDGRFPGTRWVPLPSDRDLGWLADWLDASARPVMARPQPANRPQSAPVRVLLIEPDDILRDVISARLISRGECVTACSSLQEARAALLPLCDTGHAPHAVVSRVSLPDGDAIGFYLAARQRLPQLRWILITPPERGTEHHRVRLIQRRRDAADALSQRLSTFSSFHPPTLESRNTPS